MGLQGGARAILLTGVSGSIGRHLGRFLRARGYEVVGVDLCAPPRESCDEFYKQDILELQENSPIARNRRWDALVHLAALLPPKGAPEHDIFRVNVLGTYNVFRLAAQNRITKVIFMSSDSVLGFTFSKRFTKPQYVPIDEKHPTFAHDTYGLSKLLGEQMARSFSFETDATVFCLRPPWVWVPEETERYLGLIQHPEEWAHGLWAYIVVEDLCTAVEKLIRYEGTPGCYTFFVAANDIGAPLPPHHLLQRFYQFDGPFKKGFRKDGSVISSRALQRFLGWQPRWSWRSWLPPAMLGENGDDG